MGNTDLQHRYDELWEDAKRVVAADGFALDDQIGSPTDTRYGVTLRLRPSPDVRRRIIALLDEFREIEPGQYYYGDEDFHVTVLSLLTCRPGFTLDQLDIPGYIALLGDCLADQPPFALRFHGVTASPSCVMVQGFGAIAAPRDQVRAAFRASTLEHTIDLRYITTLAHSTVLRLREPVRDGAALLELIERHRETELGVTCVDELELVGSNWYHAVESLQMLARYELGG